MSNKKWEYKNMRFDFKGRGITQEINLLDIDGVRMKGWYKNISNVPTLPEILNAAGADGWELISHIVNQDMKSNGVTLHYLYFKREVI